LRETQSGTGLAVVSRISLPLNPGCRLKPTLRRKALTSANNPNAALPLWTAFRIDSII
jgi:hypothetical protein